MIFFDSSSILNAQRFLAASSRMIGQSLERLSTGLRINRGSDDPAGLISSENLGSMLATLDADVRAMSRADHVAGVAEGSLGAAAGLLQEANSLAVQAASPAGLSVEEREALQTQMDSILSAVDRLGVNTSFGGDPLLEGSSTVSAGGESVDLPELSAAALGETDVDGTDRTLSDLGSGGALNLVDGDNAGAQQVIRNALTDVAEARGRIGAFQNNMGFQIQARGIAIESTAAALGLIRDTEYALEISALNRALVLRHASLRAFGVMSLSPAATWSLLGD
jgi:flagellin